MQLAATRYSIQRTVVCSNFAVSNSNRRMQLLIRPFIDQMVCRHKGLQQQQRTVASTIKSENPYTVLNVAVNSNYETVKAAFLKAALQHHPDHSKSINSTVAFVRIRQAFEEIVSYQNDNINNTTGHDKACKTWSSDSEFYEWFKKETGEHLAFDMNHETRQEVIHVYRTMSSGGRDRGGYWEMARLLAEREDAFHRAGGSHSKDSDEDTLTSRQASTSPTSTRFRRKRNR
jgi:DnaJ-class molecular chaperone